MKRLFLLVVLGVGLAGCTAVSRHVDPQTGEVTTQTTTVVPVPVIVPRRVEPQPYYAPRPYYAPIPHYVPPQRRYYYGDRWHYRPNPYYRHH